METQTRLDVPAYQLANLKPSPPSDSQLDTVRALHQTVISLRTKLGSTENKLRRLRETVGGFSNREYVQLVQRLALENHVLRRKIIDDHHKRTVQLKKATKMESEPDEKPPEKVTKEVPKSEEKVTDKKPVFEVTRSCASDEDDFDKDDKLNIQQTSEKSAERLELADELSLKSVSEGLSEAEKAAESRKPSARESEDESEELDDIELIFTTEETCQNVGLQEDNLVSIEEEGCWQKEGRKLRKHEQAKSLDHQPTQEQQQTLKGAKTIDLAQELVCNGADKINTSIDEAISSQSSSIDREESIDRFDESSSTRLNKMWSQCSVLVETDISKCGVLEEEPSGDQTAKNSARRNTLAAPFMMAYRPIIHREALALNSRRKSSGAMTSSNAPLRPVVDYRACGARRESGAQTDISALPAQWRSESYLAHKVAHTFTTLPSKFAFPTGLPGPGKLRLSEKTREARRVMLSDISFTSMVPELSRSADHLCQDPHAQACYNNNNSNNCSRSGTKTPEVNRQESLGSPSGYWTSRYNASTGLPSPCECRHSSDLYSTRYQGSLSSIPSPGLEVCFGGPLKRHSWRAATNPSTTSFDALRIPSIATAAIATPTETISRCNWSCSMPSSPTHVHPPTATRPANATRFIKHFPKRTRSKVTFQECPMSRGSLPNLRSELIGENSGDSTESLIDEAEDYLRRSIDSMLTMSGVEQNWSDKQIGRRRRTRRYSEPDLFKEWNPPQDARPYLPKVPRDLKLDHLVKVISPEGKVLQGRVRYVGSVPGYEDTYVGVELLKDNGFSNGTFNGIRYFYCEPDRAVFVPFKKVVLAWCTT